MLRLVRTRMRTATSWPLVFLCILGAATALSGCAKSPEPRPMQASAAVPAPVTRAPQADTTPPATAGAPSANGHSDDGTLPGDPMADKPPMPVALLAKSKKQVLAANALIAQPAQAAALPASGAGFRGSFGASDNPKLDSKPVAFLTKSLPNWTPVDTVVTDDHLPPDAIALVEEADPYLLDAGDRVRVFVYGQPNLSRTYPVDVAGTISMPLIGAVKARGITVQKLKTRIAAALGVKYVRDPEVAVEVTQYRPFFILGEVRNAWVSGLTVQTAVAIAGGYSPRATQRSVRVTRRIDGVLSEIDVPTSYAIKPGDTVYVQERFF
jgi:polysaccharide biosynthesis/export protein